MPVYSVKKGYLYEQKMSRNARLVRRSRIRQVSQKSLAADSVHEHKSSFQTLAGTGFLGGLFLVGIFGLLGVYVSVMNASAVRGAQVRSLDDHIAALESQRGELEIKAARLRAHAHASIAQENDDLQKASLTQYIEIIDDATIAAR
jgi:hypothetical protein